MSVYRKLENYENFLKNGPSNKIIVYTLLLLFKLK